MNKIFISMLLCLFVLAGLNSSCSKAKDAVKINSYSEAETLILIGQLLDLDKDLKDATAQKADAKARIALRKLTNELMQDGANQSHRSDYTMILLQNLEKVDNFSVGLTLIMEIQLVGKEEAIKPLIKTLKHGTLYKPATRALISIHQSHKNKRIKKALAKAFVTSNKQTQATFIKAVNDLGINDDDVLRKLLTLSKSDDKKVRISAYSALGSIADMSSKDILFKAIDKSVSYERGRLFNSNYLWVKGTSKDDKSNALQHCRKLINKASSLGDEGAPYVVAGLSTLYDIEGPVVIDELIKYLKHKNLRIRSAVGQIIISKKDSVSQKKLLKLLDSAKPSTVVVLYDILLSQQNKKVKDHIIRSLTSKNETLRKKALSLAPHQLNESRYLPVLLKHYVLGGDKSKRESAFKIFTTIKDSKNMNQVIKTSQKLKSDHVTILALQLCGERAIKQQTKFVINSLNSSNKNIRKAALKSLASTIGISDIPQVMTLLAKISKGTEIRSLQSVVVKCMNQSTIKDKTAAIKILQGKLSSASEKELKSLFNIICRTGSEYSLRLVSQYAKDLNKSMETQKNALKSIGLSENYAANIILVELIEINPDETLRILGINALCMGIVNSEAKRYKKKSLALLQRAYLISPNSTSSKKLESLILKNGGKIGKKTSSLDNQGFKSIFNAVNLDGWVISGKKKAEFKKGAGYIVKNGAIVALKHCGNLYTEKTYDNYILRFDFKLNKGGNSGLGLRCKADGSNVAYSNFECQIIDNVGWPLKNLKPWQVHASIYGVVPAKTGALKPAGQWNTEEIYFNGTTIRVTVNGSVIVDTDLKNHKPLKNMAKGLLNARGHIALCGHGAGVSFKNIKIKTLNNNDSTNNTKDNIPPKGFVALFDGKTLKNWKGLLKGSYNNPIKRAKLSKQDLKKHQAIADKSMRDNWKVEKGVLVFNGKGLSLCTVKEYEDYELFVSWKIKKNGDSGIYLHGTPQIQIWDTTNPKQAQHGNAKGSGGFWNNKKEGRFPLVKADKPVGQWNTFFIRMIRGKASIYLNGQLVINNALLENYWDKKSPIFKKGQIELQNHGNTLYFKNIYIKEIKTLQYNSK